MMCHRNTVASIPAFSVSRRNATAHLNGGTRPLYTLPTTGFLESGRRIALVETNAEDTADLPPVQLLIL
jgi:hypothetical protein